MADKVAPKKSSHTCEICTGIFYKPYNLRRHMINVHGYTEDELKHKISSIIHTNSSNIHTNSSNIHKNGSNINVIDLDNDFECFKCKKTFSRDWSLKRHMEKCEGIKDKFSCQYCNKLFSHEKSRFKHYKICISKKQLEINKEPIIDPIKNINNIVYLKRNNLPKEWFDNMISCLNYLSRDNHTDDKDIEIIQKDKKHFNMVAKDLKLLIYEI